MVQVELARLAQAGLERDGAGLVLRLQEVRLRKQALQATGRALGAVEERDVAQHGANLAPHERVVRAAKNDAVHLAAVLAHQALQQLREVRRVQVALLDAGGKAGARRGDDRGVRPPLLRELVELVELQGDGRRHDQDAIVLGRKRRRLERGLHAHDGKVRIVTAQAGGRDARRGVARDHDGLCAASQQALHVFAREPQHLVRALLAIRRVCRVAKEHEVLVRQRGDHAAQDADAADAGVEDADTTLFAQNVPPSRRRGCDALPVRPRGRR